MQYGLSLPNGGNWGNVRIFAELAELAEDSGWDGACLYKHQTHFMTPDDIRTLRDFVQSQRGTLDGYDIAVGGSPRRADWEEERDYIRSLAEAGATWWTEYIPPNSGDIDVVRAFIRRGPLRID